MSFHKLSAIGNTGSVRDLHYFDNGTAVLNFSLATNRSWRNADGEKQTETTWFDCAVYGARAESLAEFIYPDMESIKLHVEGTVEARAFERKDGELDASINVRVTELTFLGGGKRDDAYDEDEDDAPRQRRQASKGRQQQSSNRRQSNGKSNGNGRSSSKPAPRRRRQAEPEYDEVDEANIPF